MIEIDANKPVYDLIQEHPELREILVKLGFTPLANEAMLNTAGRMMHLNGGAKRIKLDHEELVKGLNEAGYTIKEA